jgi:hypothetical protein
MVRLCGLVIVCVLIVCAVGETASFEDWMVSHDKRYTTKSSRDHHAAVWLANDKIIRQHNTELHSFTLGHNQFSDLTEADFRALHFGLNLDLIPPPVADLVADVSPLPPAKDWTEDGAVTQVTPALSECWVNTCTV